MVSAATKSTSEPIRKRARFAVNTKNNKADEVQLSDFESLAAPHPYGVLPGGNRLWAAATTSTSGLTLSDLVSNDDECWHNILSFLNANELACVSQTSKFGYVAAHQPELWRDLVLRRLDQEKKSITTAGPTWKDTFVKLFHPTYNAGKQHYHKPIRVSGVYSEYYYRLHSCRSFGIPKQWLASDTSHDDNTNNPTTTTTVPRVSVEDMTTEKFLNEFEKPNRPVVISGGCISWKASQKWNDPNYLLQHTTPNQTFRATSGIAPLPANFTLQAYMEYSQALNTKESKFKSSEMKSDADMEADSESIEDDSALLHEEAPLYLFDRTALQPESTLWYDYMPDLQQNCPYWDPAILLDEKKNDNDTVGHDLFQLLGEGARPDHTWLIIGPQRSGSVFHIDPNATHAWNATITGRKHWIFYPPSKDNPPPGVHPSDDGDQVALPLSVGEWIFQFWPEHGKRKKKASSSSSSSNNNKFNDATTCPMECTTEPGDIIFVPHGWWHMVINLDLGANIAVTHNYASYSNLENVLRFLNSLRDQVSGCRDRKESIKPDRLYEELVEKLRLHSPDQLQNALDIPDWTCHAWRRTTTNNGEHHKLMTKKKNKEWEKAAAGKPNKGQSVMERAKSGETFSFSFQ